MTMLRGLTLLILALLAPYASGEPPVLLADWKSFFHGDPPPLVKAPPPGALAVVSSAPGTVPDAQIESFMRTFAGALMARDGALVIPRLSKNYAVDGMPDDAKASDFMIQAVAKLPGPTQIVIRSVDASGGVRAATAEFHYGPDKVTVKIFRFDSAGNLLSSDLFSLVRA